MWSETVENLSPDFFIIVIGCLVFLLVIQLSNELRHWLSSQTPFDQTRHYDGKTVRVWLEVAGDGSMCTIIDVTPDEIVSIEDTEEYYERVSELN